MRRLPTFGFSLGSCTANFRYLGRYSIEKLQVFYHFHANATLLDVLLEILWAPIPLLFVMLALEAVPLGDPHAGARHNVSTFIRSTLSHSILIAAMLVAIKRSLRIPDEKYSMLRIGCIGVTGGILLELTWLPFAIFWRYPVPFREFLGLIPFTILVIGLNVVLARDVLLAQASKLKTVLPLLGSQLSIFYGFFGLSIVFALVPIGGQIAMIATLQIVKILAKNLLWRLARRLDDISTDVTICIVEMSGSWYQTVCLQYANNVQLELVIITLDFLQAMYEVHTHMGRTYHTDNRRTLQTAVKIVGSALYPGRLERPSLARHRSSLSPLHRGDRGSWLPTMLSRSSSRLSTQRLIQTEIIGSVMPPPLLGFGQPIVAGSVNLSDPSSQEHPSVVTPLDESQLPDSTHSARSDPSHALQRKPSLARRASWMTQIRGRSNRVLAITADGRGSTVVVGAATGIATPTSYPEQGMHAANPSVHLEPPDQFEPPDLRRGNRRGNRVRSTKQQHPLAPVHARRSSRTAKSPPRGSRAAVYAVALDSEPTTQGGFPVAVVASPGPEGAIQTASSTQAAPPGTLTTLPSNVGSREENDATGSFSQATVIDGLVIARRDQAHILQQSLQLLFACEVLVFVEFMEMFVPLVYGTYVGVAWHLPNARYSLVLRSMTRANMYTTVITSFISSGLELISFLWLSWLMHRRYGISPLRQLAFVLGHYRGTFHGKLIGCFITIVLSATVHQGMEFLFEV